MSQPTFKPSEGKREEFRKYLEKNGVMDALTKVLVNLYEEVEKPEDALEYIRDKLAMQAGLETLNQMKMKQEELEAKIEELQNELNQLKMEPEAPPHEGEEFPPEEGFAEGEAPPPGDDQPPPAEPEVPAEEPPAPVDVPPVE